MPFFSFVLRKKCFSAAIGLSGNKHVLLQKNIRYFSKNTKVWKSLNSRKLESFVDKICFEKHLRITRKTDKIIFCLPPNIGIGDTIEYGLALKAIVKNNIFSKIAVAFCPSDFGPNILKDILKLRNVYYDFISENMINKYDGMFHFSTEISALKLQNYQRENIEKEILDHFKIKNFFIKVKHMKKKIKRVSIFPISKSPVRTLPYKLINSLIFYLRSKNFIVDIVLDDSSTISNVIKKNIEKTDVNIYSPNSFSELQGYIKNIDLGIFADSGPYHLSKLYGQKNFLISTSVQSKNIIGNFTDTIFYNSHYTSSFCSAPCGLTNIINYKNQHGCFDTLKVKKDDILISNNISNLNRGDLSKSYKYFTSNPVGCVRSLSLEKIKPVLEKFLKISI